MPFPDDFIWGVSLSGFQFEMGDPKGDNIDPNTDWYHWVHDGYNIDKRIVSGDLPEDGVDYWTFYKKDHALAKEMGLNSIRIGIEWSRIFPTPTFQVDVDVEYSNEGYIINIAIDSKSIEKLSESANKKALNKYREIIMDLRERGFKVFVCLNHFTLPIWIHDPLRARKSKLKDGPLGWLDTRTIIEFTKYCAYMAYEFGDIIDHWATINEPMIIAEAGYLRYEGFPPYYNDLGFPPSLIRSAFGRAVINIVNAHARAYDAIKSMDREKADDDSDSPAEVGVIHSIQPAEPLRPDNEDDVSAARFASHVHNYFFIEAITQGWLDADFDGVKRGREVKGYLRDRLDWLGLNYYNRMVVRGKLGFIARRIAGIPAFFELADGYGFYGGMRRTLLDRLLGREPKEVVAERSIEGYPVSEFGWEVYPQGIARCLDMMKKYRVPIYITENGVADSADRLRPWFIAMHLRVLEKKIEDRDLDLRGYFHWALTDNYEWARGFKMKFGLYYVDLKSKERIPRRSVSVFREIISNRSVDGKLIDEMKL